jgi:Leu/Phe-tRNA-protein transferase
MPLRYTDSGYLVILPEDDVHQIVDTMLATGYDLEFCLSPDFSPVFIARLMEAGFLVMSTRFDDSPPGDSPSGESDNNTNTEAGQSSYILLPKLHLVRSALFYENLHIKKSIRRHLRHSGYELCFDTDFDFILNHCVEVHGSGWLTPPLVEAIRNIRNNSVPPETIPAAGQPAYPASFALYRDGKLAAGEFGVVAGRVYTSYSGYYSEDNAGTVQLILAAHYLRDHGFTFFDLGMPLPYKNALGAVDISPAQFVSLFRSPFRFCESDTLSRRLID